MAVTVTLVVGKDGSTTKGGTSGGVSNKADRTAFLARRRSADCILIGGATARLEPYHRTPVPVVVISRSLINPLADNRLAHCWNLTPVAALERAIATFGSNIQIEAGISIIEELIAANRVDFLELSITEVTGGEHRLNIEDFLSHFSIVHDEYVEGTRFISAENKPAVNESGSIS
jgi:riboflavin biosynthesis pyrimidine reductase